MGMVDAFIAYKFIKILTTPFEESDAYKLGIIDEKGTILKKRKELKSGEEKKAYTIIHTLVWNLKKILVKVQLGKSRMGSLAAALYFLKEEFQKHDADPMIVEELFISCLEMMDIDVDEFQNKLMKESFENEDTLSSGNYRYNEELLIISEELESFDSVFNIPLFFINKDGNKLIFSKDELKGVSSNEIIS
jgi:hypothetical protein